LNPKPDIWILLNVPSSGTLFLNPQGTVDAGMQRTPLMQAQVFILFWVVTTILVLVRRLA
jgi:hypothetical protein